MKDAIAIINSIDIAVEPLKVKKALINIVTMTKDTKKPVIVQDKIE